MENITTTPEQTHANSGAAEAADSYMEICHLTQHEIFKTLNGAAYETFTQAQQAFESFQVLKCPDDQATFVLDLYDGNHDLVDSIFLNDDGFATVTGEKPLSTQEYQQIDKKYWAQAKAAEITFETEVAA